MRTKSANAESEAPGERYLRVPEENVGTVTGAQRVPDFGRCDRETMSV